MKINPDWDWRNISLLVALITCAIIILLLSVFGHKINFIKKSYKRSMVNTFAMILALAIGFSIAISNNFTIFSEDKVSEFWYGYMIYIISGITGSLLTLMILWYLFMLPFRYFSNICLFSTFRKPVNRFWKVTIFYIGFATIAILVACLQYFMQDSFFAFDSPYTSDRKPLDPNFHPMFTYVGRFFFSFVISEVEYTMYLIGSITLLILIQISYIFYMKKKDPAKLFKISSFCDKVANKAKLISYATPILIFFSSLTSLLVQPAATFLNIALVIMLMTILLIVIAFVNIGYSISTRSINLKDYFSVFKVGFRAVVKNVDVDDMLREVRVSNCYDGFNKLTSEHNSYNIFATIIFPILIAGYLGFANGPLLKTSDINIQLSFWLSLFIVGYLFNFAYSFKSNNIAASKTMISIGTAYIVTGFNTGTLNFFNPIINRLANMATFSSYLSLACHKVKQLRV
ncbi:MAG: hypothetical protein ACRC4M_01360 [Mycoplasma sp.]